MTTRTKAENYARFREIFADEPELLEMTRPEAMPASVEARPTGATDTDRLEARLVKEFPTEDVQAIPCP